MYGVSRGTIVAVNLFELAQLVLLVAFGAGFAWFAGSHFGWIAGVAAFLAGAVGLPVAAIVVGEVIQKARRRRRTAAATPKMPEPPSGP